MLWANRLEVWADFIAYCNRMNYTANEALPDATEQFEELEDY